MSMPGTELAQYGIATFALAGVFYFALQIIKQRNNSSIAEVIVNNTRAVERNIQVTEQLILFLRETMARQDQKLDELLEKARR